jgi:hypothetical protein
VQNPDKEIQPIDFGSSSSNTIATRLFRVKAAAATAATPSLR